MGPEHRYLSDTGIKQAIDAGLLAFDPPLAQAQVQPASVDLHLEGFYERFTIEEMIGEQVPLGAPPSGVPDLVLPAHHEAIIECTQRMRLSPRLRCKTELRSSLRRLACYAPSGITMAFGGQLHVELKNHGPLDIQFTRGDKVAQLLFTYSYGDPAYTIAQSVGEDDETAKRHQELLNSLDAGVEIGSPAAAAALVEGGHLTVTPHARFEGALLAVHAGKTARVLREHRGVDFSSKQSIADAFEPVPLPYTLKPGEHLVVDTLEELHLSPHVGIHFYDYLIGTSRGPSLTRQTPGEAFGVPVSIPDGWVDPGYQGTFSRQPKTYYPHGTTIREGDVLGHGFLVYFPRGVGRSYGTEGLGSHYQHQRETKLQQNA